MNQGTSPKLAEKYPLNIISSYAFLNSCYANMTDKQRVQGDQFVLINKVDAKNRNVKSGDKVKVFNEEVLLMLSQKCLMMYHLV